MMLKIFRAFVKKEMYHIIRDIRTLIILFGMPVALVLIFGYTVTNEFQGASLGVYDQSKDGLSKEFVEHVRASEHFTLIDLAASRDQIDELFKAGKIKIALVIPPSFERNYYQKEKAEIQIISDATEPNYAATLTNYANAMIGGFNLKKFGDKKIPYQIKTETRMFYNPELVGAYNFIPGVVALILMLLCAMMTSLTIAREKELGTMDLLLVSPLPPLLIILGKVTPYAVLSFLSTIMVLVMGNVIFDVPVVGNLALLLVLCFLYLLVALGLGLLISTKAKSQQVAMVLSMFALMLPTMLLSGFIFPIESMPVILQVISNIIPAKYFIIIEKAIMLKGAGLASIYPNVLVLILMFLIFIGAALKNFKVIYSE